MSDAVVHLTIDGRAVEAPAGATVLEAARQVGIEIPTLCHLPGKPPLTSCFVCMVRVGGQTRLVPSCATQVRPGMVVESETEEVHAARRTALELLLSDHLGDCQAPCRMLCPARMDVAAMNRAVLAGDMVGALKVVKQSLALPGVLGRLCPGMCEKGCRRHHEGGSLAIGRLHGGLAELDLASGAPWVPELAQPTGKRVAIVGAGPAGLSAAYYLQASGHACTVFDDHDEPGGALLDHVPESRLPRELLRGEVALICALGVSFELGERVEQAPSGFDAVLVAAGEGANVFGLERGTKGIKTERPRMSTDRVGVFVAGAAIAPTHHTVNSVADGRMAAEAIDRYLRGDPTPAKLDDYTVRIGRLEGDELAPYLRLGSPASRHDLAPPVERELLVKEAARCLHCDCRKLTTCKLRRVSQQYGANPEAYKGERREFAFDSSHPDVIYEPGKCIACGICVQVSSDAGEELGLTFVGRGFGVRAAPPFGESLGDALRLSGRACAEACPTAAISLKRTEHADE